MDTNGRGQNTIFPRGPTLTVWWLDSMTLKVLRILVLIRVDSCPFVVQLNRSGSADLGSAFAACHHLVAVKPIGVDDFDHCDQLFRVSRLDEKGIDAGLVGLDHDV